MKCFGVIAVRLAGAAAGCEREIMGRGGGRGQGCRLPPAWDFPMLPVKQCYRILPTADRDVGHRRRSDPIVSRDLFIIRHQAGSERLTAVHSSAMERRERRGITFLGNGLRQFLSCGGFYLGSQSPVTVEYAAGVGFDSWWGAEGASLRPVRRAGGQGEGGGGGGGWGGGIGNKTGVRAGREGGGKGGGGGRN